MTTDPTGFLDDIWEYQHSSGQWIWWKGTTNVNQNGTYTLSGVGDGLPFVKYVAGGRRGASVFKQDSGGGMSGSLAERALIPARGTRRDTSTIFGPICHS